MSVWRLPSKLHAAGGYCSGPNPCPVQGRRPPSARGQERIGEAQTDRGDLSFRGWRHAMKTALLQESSGSRPDGFEKTGVTIFYPDATYGAQLVGAFHRAVGGLGEMKALDPRPWRLDVLQWPEMEAEATRDIANSRIVVVPADDAYASSEFFRRWVETWPAALDEQRLLLVPRRGTADTPP